MILFRFLYLLQKTTISLNYLYISTGPEITLAICGFFCALKVKSFSISNSDVSCVGISYFFCLFFKGKQLL